MNLFAMFLFHSLYRMHELNINQMSNSNEDHEIVNEIISDDETPTTILSQNNKRPTMIHWEFAY